MHICLVTPELPPYVRGGIGAYVFDLATGYAARGHKVSVVGYRIHDEMRIAHPWGESVSLGSNAASTGRLATTLSRVADQLMLTLGRYASRLPWVWRVGHWWAAKEARRAARLVRDYLTLHGNTYDIVEIANWPGHGAYVPCIRGKYVVRLSTSSRDTNAIGRWFTEQMERQACLRAHLIIAHTQAMNLKGREYYAYDPACAVVVHLGVPDVPLPQEFRNTSTVEFLYVGRAERRKGTDLLLKALSIVLPRHPTLRMTFVGADIAAYASGNQELSDLWNTIQRRFSAQVSVLGRVSEEEKCRVYSQSHWVVIPSRFESFGLVAVEAMRAGTPVIAASVGGLAEVCEKASTSRMFVPDDVLSLSAAFDEVLGLGPAFAEQLRASTRAAYIHAFRADRMVDESLHHYARVLNKASSTGCDHPERL